MSSEAAGAAQHLHGVVLTVVKASGQVIVRHDAFGTMPGMTMTFRIVPRNRAAQLQVGSEIDADVSTATEPWTLSNVTSRGAVAAPTSAITDVQMLKLGDTVPDDASFVDQHGRPFRFSSLRGSDVIMSFIYTRCQDARMCPLISAKYNQLQQLIGARKVRLVEITLDPTYDRPPVLQRYATTFGARYPQWQIVVGDAQPTTDFALRFGIGAFPDPNVGIIHDENTVLVDRTGKIRQEITETSWSADELLSTLDADEGIVSGNPISRFNLWLSSAAVAICGNGIGQFSGLLDLIVVIVIFVSVVYILYRLVKKVFLEV